MTNPEYDFWNERYATDSYIFGTRPAAFLEDAIQFIAPSSKVLVPADGEGRNSVFLAEHGHDVTATDFSDAAINKARELARSKNVHVDFRHADLQSWQWPIDEYDAVVAIFIQFAPPDFRTRIFNAMKASLKYGGLVLLHGYTPKQLEYKTGGPSALDQLYTEELLREYFGTWEVLRLHSYERELDEGPGHSGMSALIDCIVRKP